MRPNTNLWFSRTLTMIWLPMSAWHNPCLIRLAPEASGDPAVLNIEPFIDPISRPHVQSGYDWFWYAESTSIARLIRARNVAPDAARSSFPWFSDALTLALEWLEIACPGGVREAERLAQSPVALPNAQFIQDALGLVESGVLPRWIGWEKDAAKRGETVSPVTVATVPVPQPDRRQRKPRQATATESNLFA